MRKSKKQGMVNRLWGSLFIAQFVLCSPVASAEMSQNSNIKNQDVAIKQNAVKDVKDSVALFNDFNGNVNKNFAFTPKKMMAYDINLSGQYANEIDIYHIANFDLASNYTVSKLSSPQRIVLDAKGLKISKSLNFNVPSQFINSVRVGDFNGQARFVFDVKANQNIIYDVKSGKQGLDICISNSVKSIDKYYASLNKNFATNTPAKDLMNIANKNIEIKKDFTSGDVNKEKDIIENKSQEKNEIAKNDSIKNDAFNGAKFVVTKVFGTENNNQYNIQLAVRNGVTYDLKQSSANEYVLKMQNTLISKEAQNQLNALKTSGNISDIQASVEKDNAVISFKVANDVSLKASPSKIGILISGSLSHSSFDGEKLMARPNIEKISNENEKKYVTEDDIRPQGDVNKLNQEGEIAIEEAIDEDEKGLGNKEEINMDELDEDLAKLLDASSGYTGKLISLDFQDTEIDNALKIIAEVSNLNIVASDDVTGKVSLRLNNVPWDQALDVILKTNGLDKVQEGNVIRIAPVERLKKEREDLKQTRQTEESMEPLQLAFRKVSYAKAAELQALIETVLSDRGSVTFDDRSNQIFIKDVRSRIKDAFEIIKKADLRTPQILLETQIIEAQRNLLRELGSEFGFTFIESNETGNGTGYNFPASVTASGSTSDDSNSFASFPAAVDGTAGSAVSLIFDSLDGSKSLSLRLSGLEDEGKIKTISKPSVVTTNNTPAEIKSVESINVKLPDSGTNIATGQGASASGTSKSATESIDVGITLKVTPQASPDYYVLLDMMGESSQFGSREVDGIPSIITRRATSTVLVSSGQTFALGGVYKVTDKESLQGVPFLKDIPVLGHFFRHSKVDGTDEELIFFVTPRIVEGSFDDAE